MDEKIKEGFADLLVGQDKKDKKCLDKAKTCFHEVLNSNTKNSKILADAYRGIGIAEYEFGNYTEAIEHLSKSITSHGTNPDTKSALFYRGKAYLDLSKTKEACQDFEKAKDLGHQGAWEMINNYCK